MNNEWPYCHPTQIRFHMAMGSTGNQPGLCWPAARCVELASHHGAEREAVQEKLQRALLDTYSL